MDTKDSGLGWTFNPLKIFRREILPLLADLRLAIALLLVIAISSISGTVIEQGESINFYQENYPEKPALFGFLTWKVILLLELDHVYRTWWFLSILVLFGASLTACTFTRQMPALKSANRWKFYNKKQQFENLALSTEIEKASLDSLEKILQQRGYQVFQEGDKLYGRKGIIGKIGPIIVHASMLIILAGSIVGSMTGFIGQEIVPSGETFQIKNIVDAGIFAESQIPQDWLVRVNRFWIDYTPEGAIDQFYSDLSVLDKNGSEVDRKTIFVNQPMRYHGVTMYQADWAIAAVQVRVNRSPVFELPMAKLNTAGGGRIWGTWIPTKPDLSEGVSLLARDLQGTVLIYDATGKLVASVREGMSTEVNGITLFVDKIIGSTGLQIKADPGIPIVYLGFGLLMLSVLMSYVSHSQIWAWQESERVYIGGKTNRASVAFEREMLEILDRLDRKPLAKVADTV
ncbi:MAG: cytochrome c biogenesis protein [Okeania sp. SIO2G4]|uniref:cytochrome c biogenesis protein n=1 Tax=unclassified Okeania TaxID=2634635 RepID=UPI0013B79808|nr:MULTISPECIES: cytochrome c biogenesis protein [unclassified Okeania]NEP05338.1 cytochrome c biogenesis protein [Okeania sp. SIO4D6]NEP42198.1 cytochrome c biogenesis protein [Okeania sp. SIO2H7]NEP75599.1 cytochrome c biogenesis protein [Okeania sp. SIO2G5]NEP96726.1 cytochrome c biogenesis protein [Okeania sp. SIO2F5]NEQ94444.1 cytochrome c biogenesis protein [Okeania sp. SIO2G4]